MADQYGPLLLPAPATTLATQTVTDPLLDTLLAFFKAIINTNGDVAWISISPGDKHAVMNVFALDPNDGQFNTRDLPALFLFRSDVQDALWLAQDYYIRPTELTLLWIPPPVTQDKRAKRATFINLVASALDSRIDPDGREPGWIVAGDTDPIAAYQGSQVFNFASGLWSLNLSRAQKVAITLSMADQSPNQTYTAVRMTVTIQERNINDNSTRAFPYTLGGSMLGAGSQDLVDFDFKPTLASISPASGTVAGGTLITIQGTNLGGPKLPTVVIGGNACTGVAVTDGGIVTATVPASGAIGARDLTITTSSGEIIISLNGFTYF